jgi:hypothetical protein
MHLPGLASDFDSPSSAFHVIGTSHCHITSEHITSSIEPFLLRGNGNERAQWTPLLEGQSLYYITNPNHDLVIICYTDPVGFFPITYREKHYAFLVFFKIILT